ncbi:hypothetical protein [Acidicapsa acidisoli]|nr:hypothetical protein [Acidicapsa acidisoli]
MTPHFLSGQSAFRVAVLLLAGLPWTHSAAARLQMCGRHRRKKAPLRYLISPSATVRRCPPYTCRLGSALARFEGIKAFSETDQTDDLKAITVPTLVMQGDDDQIVPYKDAALLQAKLLKHGTLKIYPGFLTA